MDQQPTGEKRRKTPSDEIREATIAEYLQAHSKPNGNGRKGFFHSNLFVALLVWSLSQAGILGGMIISYYVKTSQLAEWKGQVDATFKRMDERGTNASHYNDEREDKDIAVLEKRMDKVEDLTKHMEVFESEHRRLTQDVEELKRKK